MQCAKPSIPSNSRIIYPRTDQVRYTHGTTLYLACHQGHLLAGSPIMVCNYTTWLKREFKCIGMFSPVQKVEENLQRVCGLPLCSFSYLSKSRNALAKLIQIFSNFFANPKLAKKVFKFWRRSHHSHIVWPPPLITTYINCKPILNKRKKKKKPRANYYARMDHFTTWS